MNKIINLSLVSFILISSTLLSFYFSIYNQDFHHWSIIMNYYLDLKNEFTPFNEIYLQYGLGQPLFFLFLDKIIEINIVTIGFLTGLFYATNLLLVYLIAKKFLNSLESLLLLLIVFSVHPFIVYPWPDYLAGLSLTASLFIFINSKKKLNLFVAALFLNLSYFFRTSYLVNINLFIFAILIFNIYYFNSKKINKFVKFFYIIFTIHIIYLYINNSVFDWLYQGLFSIKDYAYGSNYKHMDKIISIVGDYGWLFLKFCKMFLRLMQNIFFTFKIENLVFTFFLLLNFYLFKFRRNFYKKNNEIIVLSILGSLGFIQSFMIFESFRNINSTILMTIPALYSLKFIKIKNINYLIISIFIFFSINLIFENIKKINTLKIENNYSFTKNNYFSNKKFTEENYEYYKKLENNICASNKEIINISLELSLPYMCNINYKKKFSPNQLSWIKFTDFNIHKKLVNKKITDAEILITTENVKSLNNIFKIKLPKDLKFFGWPHNSSSLYAYTARNN